MIVKDFCRLKNVSRCYARSRRKPGELLSATVKGELLSDTVKGELLSAIVKGELLSDTV